MRERELLGVVIGDEEMEGIKGRMGEVGGGGGGGFVGEFGVSE